MSTLVKGFLLSKDNITRIRCRFYCPGQVMIFITVLKTATCCETAALVILVIIWVIILIKLGSSNFCKDLPLFHPVIKLTDSVKLIAHFAQGEILRPEHIVKSRHSRLNGSPVRGLSIVNDTLFTTR